MPAKLRIGVNALYLLPGGVGGTEIYLRNLLGALAQVDRRNEYFVFTNRETDTELCPAADNFQLVRSWVPGRFRPLRLAWEQTVLPAQTLARGLDLLFNPGFSCPALSTGRRVTVIHDMQHRRQPQNFGRIELAAWEAVVSMAIRRSRRIITVSDSAAADIREFYGVEKGRLTVVRHGVEEAFFDLADNEAYPESMIRAAGVPDAPYLLAVSTVHPHKNFPRLLEAYARVAEAGREEQLVISGLKGKAWETISEQIARRGLSGRVHMLGWQPREVLIALFRHAQAFLFPSTFEGFGMPVVEAMAAGLPLVCSRIPPLQETAGEVAWFFSPDSVEELVEQIHRVLRASPEVRKRAKAGVERAHQFTWRRAAEDTLRVFLETVRDG